MSDSANRNPNHQQGLWQKLVVGCAAIALGVALALGIKTQPVTVSLEAQAAQSTPLEVAFTNHKPTLLEFYADWCTSCQAMAGDLEAIKTNYGDRLNFVMLNVDNGKWLPEVLKYRVDGIPHFVFFDDTGAAIAETIGEQPKTVLEEDLDALIAKTELPHIYSQGQVSKLNSAPKNSQTDPRSHGEQVRQNS